MKKRVNKLKDILDMTEYLQKRCYCAGEIYSDDGFFYQIFKDTAEYKMLGESDKYNAIFVIANSDSEKLDAQILVIFRSDDKKTISDITRYDATDNNIKLCKEFINGRTEKAPFDEYKEDETPKVLNEIFSIADAILTD